MTETVWIALFAMVATVCASTVAPAIMMALNNRARRKEKLEDYARQDEVARRLEKAQYDTQNQLGLIHGLVNSSYTEALKAQLAAHEQVLVFQKAAGGKMSKEAGATLRGTEKEIARLKQVIAERIEIAASEIAKSTAADRAAIATERVADETKRIADAAENKPEDK